VPVVVTNNSQTSAPLQVAAPAFSHYSGAAHAIASHYPGSALLGTSTAPAGFGPTNPATPMGIEVTGAPSNATLPVSFIDAVFSPAGASPDRHPAAGVATHGRGCHPG